MSKRTIIIFITLALSVFGGGAYWYFAQTTPTQTGGALFPGGSGSTTEGTEQKGGSTTGETTETPTGTRIPRLYQLHITPVAGVGFVETKDKKGAITDLRVRYIEKGLGHIFETQLSSYTEARIVNETRPRVAEALWGNGGKSVVIRFLDNKEADLIKTRVLNIDPRAPISSSGFLTTEEVYLPDSIPFLATAEDGSDNLFYLEGENGVLTNFKDITSSKIFSSVFTEWLPQFPSQKLITLTSRPSSKVPGHMFFLDTKTKSISKIIGGKNGLTTLTSHDGKFVLFAETVGSESDLSLYDVTRSETRPMYLMGFPEKCVWSTKNPTIAYCAIPDILPPATYPDQWYQGLISFSDSLWKIDASTHETKKILTPSTLGTPSLDMINLSLSSDDSYLTFLDKTTGSPWIYSIIEPQPITPPQTTEKQTSTTSVSTTTPTNTATSTRSNQTPATTTKPTISPSAVTPEMQKLK